MEIDVRDNTKPEVASIRFGDKANMRISICTDLHDEKVLCVECDDYMGVVDAKNLIKALTKAVELCTPVVLTR